MDSYVVQIRRTHQLKQIDTQLFQVIDGKVEELPVYQIVLPERSAEDENKNPTH